MRRIMHAAVALAVAGAAPLVALAAPAAAQPSSVRTVQTDAWPCDGPAQYFAARDGNNKWTCWANSGESYAKAYGVRHWQSGHNSGLFDFECHGQTGSHRFQTDDNGDLPDCTIYHVEID